MRFLRSKKFFNRSGRPLSRDAVFQSGTLMFPYFPGAFFIVLGIAAILAPKFLIALFAALLLMVGILLCYGAWRFLQLKRKVDDVMRQMSGRVIIHGVDIVDPEEFEEVQVDDEKITFH